MHARHLAIALAGLNLVLLAIMATGRADAQASVQPVVRAQLIELVDSSGRLRGQLKAEAGGEVTFRMYDARGEIRTEFGANADGSGVAFMDHETHPGIRIYSGMDLGTRRNGTNLAITVKGGKQNILKP